jgi:hypothetical protein
MIIFVCVLSTLVFGSLPGAIEGGEEFNLPKTDIENLFGGIPEAHVDTLEEQNSADSRSSSLDTVQWRHSRSFEDAPQSDQILTTPLLSPQGTPPGYQRILYLSSALVILSAIVLAILYFGFPTSF